MTEDQIAEYYREGFILVRSLVGPDVADKVVSAGPDDYTEGGQWTARMILISPGSSTSLSIFKHDDPHENAAIHQLLVEPSLVDAVEAVFEAPARVHYGMLAVVAAGSGTGLPWHQDNMYTHIAGRAINVFVALCDIPPEKAGLWVAPRSHRQGLWPNHSSERFGGHREADNEPDNPLRLPEMKKGDACLFDRYMLHRSVTNETSEHRFAYAAQYLEKAARGYETGRKDPSKMAVSELRRIWGANS